MNPTPSYARIAPTLQRISQFVETLPGAPPSFVDKYRGLADPDRGGKRQGLLEYELRLARCSIPGRIVLDAGCGTGVYSVLFALLGASTVVAVDYFAANVECLRRVAAEFSLPIQSSREDVGQLGQPSDSIDLVYCTEAISHFHDWVAFLDVAARVLRPGGRIIIGDGNNGANPTVRRQVEEFWARSEVGPFVETSTNGHVPTLPYLFRRWMIIRRHFPEATDEQVYALGLHTSHLGGQALIDACRRYFETEMLPGRPYQRGQSQIRPEDGQHNEETLDPVDLAARLRNRGLEARARAHFGFGRSPLLPLLNEVASWSGDLSLRFARRYLVIAAKR